MSISTYQEISWGNPASFYLSQVWSLYCREIDWDWQLCDLGYFGIADPKFESESPNPDILAFNPEVGDVQHIHISSFDNYEFGDDGETDKQTLIQELESHSESHSISKTSISDFLSRRGHDCEPSIQEVVCVLPKEVYSEYKAHINSVVDECDIILWIAEINGKTTVWKEEGNHSNLTLDDEISSRLKVYPSSNDILQYSRSTSRDRLEYEFIARLVRYCGRMSRRSITFDEVDEIMVTTSPPILGHLSRDNREEEFWGDFLYKMLNIYDLLDQSEEKENTYVWKGKRFVREPRYRHKILKQVRDELNIEKRGGL